MCKYDLQFIKDIILIIGSLTSTFFAFRSYNKWKKEHKGKIKYELSRNILKTILTIRDDFKSIRSPFIHPHEFMPEFQPKFQPEFQPNKSKKSENLSYVFNNRLKVIYDSSNSLSSLFPEIELEFGNNLKKLCSDIIYEIKLYQMALSEFIQISDVENIFNTEHYKKLTLQVYNIGDQNELTMKFENLIEIVKKEIEKEIKKY